MYKTLAYGLMIESKVHLGTRYVEASLMGRETKKDSQFPNDYPCGVSDDWELSLLYDGLAMRGHVFRCGEDEPRLIAYEPEYYGVYSVDLPKAAKIVKTLKKIAARIEADGAREPGEMFLALCHALKLSFVVEKRGATRGSFHCDSDWHWMSIADGKARYVAMVRAACDAEAGRESVAA